MTLTQVVLLIACSLDKTTVLLIQHAMLLEGSKPHYLCKDLACKFSSLPSIATLPIQEAVNETGHGDPEPAAEGGQAPAIESLAAEMEAYETHRRAKKAARAAAKSKLSSGKSFFPPFAAVTCSWVELFMMSTVVEETS